MSRNLGCLCGLLALCGPAVAANPGTRPGKPADEAEARAFAAQLSTFAQTVADQYAREVPRDDVLAAALQGLYEAARRPFPAEVAGALKTAKTENERIAVLTEARRRLGDDPAVQGRKAFLACLRALPKVLDQHCVVASAGDFQSSTDYHVGFGFDLDGETAPAWAARRIPASADSVTTTPPVPFRVARVHLGGPAQRAGLRPGDVLTAVDGKAITAENAAAIYTGVLAGPEDSPTPAPHAFAVLRPGHDGPLKLTAAKSPYTPESVYGMRRLADNSWGYWLDEGAKVAYVRVGAIDTHTPAQLADALNQLGDAKGLILDLRWCPGGFLTQSAEIAGLFLAEGQIAAVKYRQPDRLGASDFRAGGFGLRRARFTEAPLLVLVNGETSGGGELIAAALQDNGRAKVAGQRTLGKASIQTPLYLDALNNAAFKLTAGTFVRPSGKNLQRFAESKPEEDWGVRPDKGYDISLSASLGQRLKDWHQAHLLRPPESREALPLDDPAADPQRAKALRLLRGMMADR
jgi:carboxyl-terminal processing protease